MTNLMTVKATILLMKNVANIASGGHMIIRERVGGLLIVCNKMEELSPIC